MTEEPLERLMKGLTRMRRVCPSLAVWAIRWMYLKHPLHSVQRALLDGEESAQPRRASSWFWLVSRCVLYAASLSVRLVFLRILLRREIAALRRQSFDLVARTCCRGTQQLPQGRDFYYGDLQTRLAQRGTRMLLLGSDVLDSPWRTFAKSQVAVGPVWKLPDLCLVPPWAPLHMMWKQLSSAVQLSFLAPRFKDPLARAIACFAARDSLLPDTAFAGLAFWVAKAAVRAWRPRAFLTLYEGHAWERCARWGVKAADPSCWTVGYQHSMVFRESLSLMAPAADRRGRSVPDVVLCLGQASLELLQAGHARHPVELLRFGSFRHLASEHAGEPQRPQHRRTVLVTPEGILSETSALFAFAAACARRLPAYTFILRMFPGTVMPAVMPIVTQYLAELPNLILSDRPNIQDDYARASVIMYRGSSSVLYGTLKGLLPVYVHVPSLIDTDPLYMLTSWRRVCTTTDEFAAIVAAYEHMPDHERTMEWDGVMSYLRQYAEPVEDDAVDALLAAVARPIQERTHQRPEQLGDTASLERLAEALAAVRRLCPALPVFSIRWMYLKHPLHPVQEALLQEEEGLDPRATLRTCSGGWVERWQQVCRVVQLVGRCVAYAGLLSGRLMYLRLLLRQEIAAMKRQSFDVIAKTCCFGASRSPTGRDFYYGDLQERMAARGVRLLLLCGDVIDGSWRLFAKSHVGVSRSWRLPDLCLVHPLRPIQLMGQQLLSAWRLHRLAAGLRDPLMRAVAVAASRDCLIPDTAFAGLNFWMARAAVRRWHPRAFITFYEGHAWERCAWWGVKEADASCQTVGYQHTMVFQESLSVTAPSVDVMDRSVPDVVLCLGQVPLDLLRPGHARYPVQLLRFGSFRYHAAQRQGPAAPSRRTVLVTPEGLESEASALFAFAYECARRLPSYTFILRMFPGIAMPAVTQAIQAYCARQPNLVVSNRPNISEDYERSSILLYRGSSAALYAALRGLLPVYLHVDGLLDTDPLYLLTSWHRRCASPEEFVTILGQDERVPEPRRTSEWSSVADYLDRYAGPVGNEAVEELLASVGLARAPQHVAREEVASP